MQAYSMGYRYLFLAGVLSSCLMPALQASTEQDGLDSSQPPDLWQKTWQSADDAWRRTWELIGPSQSDTGFARMWDEIVPRLDQALMLTDRHETLPARSWFGDDQGSNQRAINQLLDEAAAILTTASSQRYRDRIRELNAAVRAARADITEYRRLRISAPRNSLWQKTVAEYDAAIADREALIAEHGSELNALHQRFAEELESLGLNVSREQLEFLLSTVVGDDLIQMGVAFDNVKAITSQLERLTEESGEDLTAARRYYGMYTVLLRVLERMHGKLIDDVDGRYLPEIDAIAGRTRELMTETQALQRRDPGPSGILAANLEAQQFTLRAAGEYRAYLLQQREQVVTARRRLGQDIAVAANTYETVKVSGELVDLMQASQRLLDRLRNLEVPALRTFENLEMKREFERLTLRLQGQSLP